MSFNKYKWPFWNAMLKNVNRKKINVKLRLDNLIYNQEYYNLSKKILILIWLNLFQAKVFVCK